MTSTDQSQSIDQPIWTANGSINADWRNEIPFGVYGMKSPKTHKVWAQLGNPSWESMPYKIHRRHNTFLTVIFHEKPQILM